MNLTRVFHTSTFRMALVYLVLFAMSSLVLLSFVYWATAGISTSQIDETIQAEVTGLGEQYRNNGLTGLISIVRERSQDQRQSLYLVIDGNGNKLVGNLNAWPNVETQKGGWLEFKYQRPVGGKLEVHRARGRHLLLDGGFQLLVGRDIHELQRVEKIMRQTLAWAVALTICLGLVGGVFMSRNFLRRIEVINKTSREIIAGDLQQRVPVMGREDELDRLARNLNKMLDQIERLVTGMRQVTENIAHDLRSPLNRLRSRLEVTLMGEPSENNYREALELTIGDTEALLETFNALLSIAQAESGQPDGAMADFDLSALAEGISELYEPVAEEKSITLARQIEAGVKLHGNRHMLSQALANLLDNAVKYCSEDTNEMAGKIVIVVRQTDAGPQLIVADSGPGIPVEDKDRVLARFVRLESSRTSSGSGLGLSLVAAVAKLHEAEIILEDNLPGLKVSIKFTAEST